ncbi:MAG: hypothetical protein A3A97_03260 [Candidatus Terrybacteria bacterium RIFCSPLOWO2_01_FULL_40_23]|uniref:Large ribosomal subunit protein bL25 n=1 Tax=Candidatus Terrybacteria bacterium RIFCSPLOWO2_01_FULL_40_23 TaxID=1802366 RepID=A0A1G2PSJ4_9BACT|nr:MAG: hypothetical protein A3A97_03260 [Candidatus Terrybacteria bacterium RIFCSPLOWO2_01_FULL_40_23]
MEILNVKTRQIKGKKVATLREQGEIPAVLYGVGIEPQSISLPLKEFQKIFKTVGETALLSLVVDSTEPRTVLIRDVQNDAMKQLPIHVDFHQVNMNEELDLDVPLEFTGTSVAVSSEGGILVKALYELPISALPADLPHEIIIDIAPLEKIGDAIHVRDIKLPKGVKVCLDEDQTIAFIEKPMSEEELAALETPVELKVDEVEVVGEKEKKEAEEAAAALEAEEKEK